ncbi:MAG: acyl carrier protein [Proteobacteria bacterium]|nr:acyl carrier protein [Pseudomonadota bacterium]
MTQFVCRNFLFTDDPGALKPGVSLIESGTMDSTGVLELIAHLEQTYCIEVADEEMLPANLDSVPAIVAFVERKLG